MYCPKIQIGGIKNNSSSEHLMVLKTWMKTLETQTWNSSKTFREQEFWRGILPQKQRMFGPLKMMIKVSFLDYSLHNHHYQNCDKLSINILHCLFVHNQRSVNFNFNAQNPDCVDSSIFCGSFQNVWYNLQSVDQSTICGLIHNLWINPQSMDQYTIRRSIHNIRINLETLDQSTIFGSIQNLWIHP